MRIALPSHTTHHHVFRYQDRVMCTVPKESRFMAIQFQAST
jgi:hypothetical protein